MFKVHQVKVHKVGFNSALKELRYIKWKCTLCALSLDVP